MIMGTHFCMQSFNTEITRGTGHTDKCNPGSPAFYRCFFHGAEFLGNTDWPRGVAWHLLALAKKKTRRRPRSTWRVLHRLRAEPAVVAPSSLTWWSSTLSPLVGGYSGGMFVVVSWEAVGVGARPHVWASIWRPTRACNLRREKQVGRQSWPGEAANTFARCGACLTAKPSR